MEHTLSQILYRVNSESSWQVLQFQALGQPEGQRAVVSGARERHICCCGQELAFGLLKLVSFLLQFFLSNKG